MKTDMNNAAARNWALGRRQFFRAAGRGLTLAATAGLASRLGTQAGAVRAQVSRTGGPHIRISCNAYSFNRDLLQGRMSIQDLLEICAKLNFDAVDLTGYYFSGYPAPPADKEIHEVKRRAFLLGLDISGTGVRNDFTTSDKGKLQSDIDLVKTWMQVAVKLGAPVVRVFPGRELEVGQRKETVYRQVARALQECSEFGEKLGVLTVVQNHNGLLKTGADVLELFGMVRSDWVALNLDIGSYRTADPYRDIRMTAPWAVTWQIKEHVYYGDQQVETDLDRIVQILHEVGYRGYIPLETLEGDPHQRMPLLMAKVLEALRRFDPATKN